MQTVKVTRAPSHSAFNNGDGYDDVVGCYEYTATTVLGLLIGIFCESPVPRKRRPNCCFNPFLIPFWNLSVMFYHALLLCSGCCRISTPEDDTDSDLTTVGINNTQIVVDHNVSPNERMSPIL